MNVLSIIGIRGGVAIACALTAGVLAWQASAQRNTIAALTAQNATLTASLGACEAARAIDKADAAATVTRHSEALKTARQSGLAIGRETCLDKVTTGGKPRGTVGADSLRDIAGQR